MQLKVEASGPGIGTLDARYVRGPASSTDNAIARWDSTTGRLLQDSGVTLSDTGVLTWVANTTNLYSPGANTLKTDDDFVVAGTYYGLPSSDVSAMDLKEFSSSPTGPIFVIRRSDGTARSTFLKTTLNSNNAIGWSTTFDTSFAVSASTARTGFNVTLANFSAGTPAIGGLTTCVASDNQCAGVDTTVTSDVSTGFGYRVGGNRALSFFARGNTATGYNTGFMGGAGLGLFNFGGWVTATTNKTNTTNIGLFADGWTTSSGGTYVGVYATNRNQAGLPTFESSALCADNDNTSAPIGIFRDNGTVVVRIADGGNVTFDRTAATSGVGVGFSYLQAPDTGLTASTEVNEIVYNFTSGRTWATGNVTLQREFGITGTTINAAGSSVFSTAAILAVTYGPEAGTNVTITKPVCAMFGGNTTQKSVAGYLYRAIDIPDHTLTFSNTTQITSTGPAGIAIGQITLAQSGGAITVDNASGLYVREPIAGASVTITNKYAIFSDSGVNRFDGDGTYVFELPADATDHTGGGGAAAGRIPVKIGGATKYIAYY